MSTFSFNDYTNAVARAQANSGNTFQKVGFFKLKNDGDEALVRFNISSVDDLQFATIHQLGANTRWMKVSCLNPLGMQSDNCPLCRAVAAGSTVSGPAAKKVYLQMLVAYKDAKTGNWAAAIPVVWERPAGFSKAIAGYLKDYGDLKSVILKVTRNGVAGDTKTTYSINYIPFLDKESFVPKDFSAFNNFSISKHSYWEKSAEDIEKFLQTGEFPAAPEKTIIANTVEAKIAYQSSGLEQTTQPGYTAYTAQPQQTYVAPQPIPYQSPAGQPVQTTPVAPQMPQPQVMPLPIATQPAPVPQAPVNNDSVPVTRTFDKYSF